MPAPPMMGASRAQFVKNSRLEIMTLSFMSARCHFGCNGKKCVLFVMVLDKRTS
jgi:hypothetical protein